MPEITPITMPKFGLAMTEGKVASWLKQEGDEIKVGDEIADIETSKITNAYESPTAGLLRRHVAPEQQDLPVGALIAVVADKTIPDTDIDAFIERFQSEFATVAAAAEEAAPEPKTVQVGTRTIRYLETGAAGDTAPILLIHGFGGDLNNWLFIQPALSETHQVFALDLPGHGGSSKDVGSGDIATFSEILRGFQQALAIPKAHLVAHSLGGAIAVHTALHDPASVASLTLIAPAGFGPEIDEDFLRDFIAANRRKQLEPVLGKLVADPSLISRDMIEDVIRFKRLDGVQQALTTIRTINFENGQREILRDRLSSLGSLPIQIVWGREDRILPSSHADGLPASVKVHLLPDSGHLPQMEKAAEVNRLILEFVR